jgi:integrative and conjugative element protein (TIGR02256 family)
VPHVNRALFLPSALRELFDHAQLARDGRETGGIVLGTDGGLTGDFQVHVCGGPGPAARRAPRSFRRDVEHAQQLTDAAAAAGSTWIGEWHTHLIDLPTPSDVDLHTYQHLLDDPETRLLRLLVLIVRPGPTGDWSQPQLHAWSFTGSVLRELTVAVLDETGQCR